ncbi:DUF3301 domain-containing protein [Alteromonas aestuariivivens]|uniref:DUF3301 domain-containing protein n=1 Tax=Alteromonas aestuariivivens TaxID=1938339 RepID=A0A3D8M424_9ALTE|nr:DUF3301 domain-containing protein [Alteromonas aestuariivivens]RDV24391.1 DUF3301 domain-containing protein [Alteromonas aestuariivivens]
MNLFDVVVLLLISLIAYQFWRIRSISEGAQTYIEHYCDSHNLQLLSLARYTTRLSLKQGKLDWKSVFIFEFSGNGEDKYSGSLEMIGRKVLTTRLPPYRVN